MISACKETREVWEELKKQRLHCRALAADRFVDFKNEEKDDDWRRRTCEAILNGKCDEGKIKQWKRFVMGLVEKPERLVFAKLQARLIINAAGGVMENGGLCLDRNSGIPYIPGSAVKGCSRRWAIQQLRDKTEERKDGKTEGKDGQPELLEQIALVFGWTEQDWKQGTNDKGQHYSDFWWAVGDNEQIVEETAGRLAKKLGMNLNERTPSWKQLPNFAGSINFLPAFPWDADPGIVLDVLTCHHQKYYQEANAIFAPDTEQPVPVVFPVISAAKEPVFVFTVIANKRGNRELENLARSWLSASLQTLGIGGKTSAGYGWFDCSEEIQEDVRNKTEQEERNLKAETERRKKEEQQKIDQEEALRKKAEHKKLMDAMTPEEKSDFEISKLNPDQFRSKVEGYGKLSPVEQRGVQKALCRDRKDFWLNIKNLGANGKAKERDRWNPIIQAIYVTAKAAKEKMP